MMANVTLCISCIGLMLGTNRVLHRVFGISWETLSTVELFLGGIFGIIAYIVIERMENDDDAS